MTSINKKILTALRSRILHAAVIILVLAAAMLIWKTRADMQPFPDTLAPNTSEISRARILDRNHVPLSITYQNQWNIYDYVPLYEIPEFLQQVFVVSEDRKFYQHSGVDWSARLSALWQNMRAFKAVRGASTITEQVVRMLHSRPRTMWSKWIEGFEARILERKFTKPEILEFYLNQIPYASNRRGVVQAARLYFDRDLDTLSRKEIMALAVMVRAPSGLDIRKSRGRITGHLTRLSDLLVRPGLIDEKDVEAILDENMEIKDFSLSVDAGHFVDFVREKKRSLLLNTNGSVITTLDSSMQAVAKNILDSRINDLKEKEVNNGAALIVHNRSGEVLAWAVSGSRTDNDPESWIDAVTAPRQPGSTLKPFVYTLALGRGWTAATIIDDAPLAEAVGTGLHSYHNYSRTYYGKLTLRECLGNSLNTPAVRTLQHTGVARFLSVLRQMGMESLSKTPDFYGDGLVLGNGEISLFELVQAYSTIANQGIYRPLKVVQNELPEEKTERVFSPEAASLIGNILSDSKARMLEFGADGVLNFPVQTAVKTGTSNDYRDAWAIGYNDEYTVGVWMGNLDRIAMDRITGAKGPAMVLRSIFAELNRNRETKPLYLSPGLVRVNVCRDSGLPANEECASYGEWFIPGTVPDSKPAVSRATAEKVKILQPTPGLQIAMDPRIPDDHESFMFIISNIPENSRVEWLVNNEIMAETSKGEYLWPVTRGSHTVMARVLTNEKNTRLETEPVTFIVK